MRDLAVLRYTTVSGDRYLHASGLRREAALVAWYELDDRRLAGELPHVRHVEVRDHGDPTNPTLRVPIRAWDERNDHPDFLRRGIRLVPDQRVGTAQCRYCGRVYQASGFGVGSHLRACPA